MATEFLQIAEAEGIAPLHFLQQNGRNFGIGKDRDIHGGTTEGSTAREEQGQGQHRAAEERGDRHVISLDEKPVVTNRTCAKAGIKEWESLVAA
jgi:hypothetical protein